MISEPKPEIDYNSAASAIEDLGQLRYVHKLLTYHLIAR